MQSLDGTMYVLKSDFDAAYRGRPVTVVYDSSKPRRSLIYEFAEYEAVP